MNVYLDTLFIMFIKRDARICVVNRIIDSIIIEYLKFNISHILNYQDTIYNNIKY